MTASLPPKNQHSLSLSQLRYVTKMETTEASSRTDSPEHPRTTQIPQQSESENNAFLAGQTTPRITNTRHITGLWTTRLKTGKEHTARTKPQRKEQTIRTRKNTPNTTVPGKSKGKHATTPTTRNTTPTPANSDVSNPPEREEEQSATERNPDTEAPHDRTTIHRGSAPERTKRRGSAQLHPPTYPHAPHKPTRTEHTRTTVCDVDNKIDT